MRALLQRVHAVRGFIIVVLVQRYLSREQRL